MSETRNEAKVKQEKTLIPIYLPLLPEEAGVTEVDQRVVVTLNGVNKILPRGQMIEVTPEEYEVLHNSGRFDRL